MKIIEMGVAQLVHQLRLVQTYGGHKLNSYQ
jgi:hypothetical protein